MSAIRGGAPASVLLGRWLTLARPFDSDRDGARLTRLSPVDRVGSSTLMLPVIVLYQHNAEVASGSPQLDVGCPEAGTRLTLGTMTRWDLSKGSTRRALRPEPLPLSL